jgi:hypothetical protein
MRRPSRMPYSVVGETLPGSGVIFWRSASAVKMVGFDPPPEASGLAFGSLQVNFHVRAEGSFHDGRLTSKVVWNFGSPKSWMPAWMAFGLSQGTWTRRLPKSFVWSSPAMNSRTPSVGILPSAATG